MDREKDMANNGKKPSSGEQDGLTELEQLKKQNEDLKSQIRLRDAREEFMAEIKAAGGNSPELAFRVLQADFQFDEETGKPTNVKELVSGFRSSFPEQFGTQAPAGGVDAGAGAENKTQALSKEDLSRMTPEQINERWAEVSKILS